MQNQELSFLNQFVKLYEDLISHEGYGDIHVSLRTLQGKKKNVSLLCGREYTFDVVVPQNRQSRYKIIEKPGFHNRYNGPERRRVFGRRDETNRRRRGGEPRNFRLERRLTTDRRKKKSRRLND